MLISSPLSNSHASLSKYIHLDDHFNLLQSITVDTTVAALEKTFDSGVVTTALGRYLLNDHGFVRRDKLVDLVHAEGQLTDRVKMVMYFLFMLRDARCRSFICNHLVSNQLTWSDAKLHQTNSTFPEFVGAGGHKAYTNLRSLLLHFGLVDESFRLRTFPPLATWFSDGVSIASQHIMDIEMKERFLETPQAVLADFGLLGLLNTPPDQVLKVQSRVPIEDKTDSLPAYDLSQRESDFDAAAIKAWNRNGPMRRTALNERAVLINPALLERANTQHFVLEKMMSEVCRQNGFSVHQTVFIDMLGRKQSASVIFEMKSCTIPNIRGQVRRGISQLLEYRYLYRAEVSDPHLCLVVERKPRGNSAWLMDYVESLGIHLIWKQDKADAFGCSKTSRERLVLLFPEIGGWKD